MERNLGEWAGARAYEYGGEESFSSVFIYGVRVTRFGLSREYSFFAPEGFMIMYHPVSRTLYRQYLSKLMTESSSVHRRDRQPSACLSQRSDKETEGFPANEFTVELNTLPCPAPRYGGSAAAHSVVATLARLSHDVADLGTPSIARLYEVRSTYYYRVRVRRRGRGTEDGGEDMSSLSLHMTHADQRPAVEG